MRELVELDLVGVELRGVGSRMAHERLERDQILVALAEEAVGESVSELVRRELSNPGALADAANHPPQRLIAGRQLRILRTPHPLVLGHPLLDLDREDVVVQLRLELAKACTDRSRAQRSTFRGTQSPTRIPAGGRSRTPSVRKPS